ncbi:hypothetical protein BLA29_010261 [Euroglyphus maynei]|uniref:Uncharacterized protein n=1 Tax=Euroglyphus maynei TaxID=6958 RepID=A0A1Y3AMX1_EURMA|nr:hypothetical protein BLA29_010261 [Euroglyphus maynei]
MTKENPKRTSIIILITIIISDFLMIALQSQIVITSEPNDFTKNWQNPPIPITLDAYIFSIDNPTGFSSGRERAKIREFGPYSYR